MVHGASYVLAFSVPITAYQRISTENFKATTNLGKSSFSLKLRMSWSNRIVDKTERCFKRSRALQILDKVVKTQHQTAINWERDGNEKYGYGAVGALTQEHFKN